MGTLSYGSSVCLHGNKLFCFIKSTGSFFLYASVTFLVHTSKEKTTNPSEKEKAKLSVKDALNAMQVGISAGYSLDNTIREARKDLERLYGEKAEMARGICPI